VPRLGSNVMFKKLSIAAITLLICHGVQPQLCTGQNSGNVGFCTLDGTNSCTSSGYDDETSTDDSCGDPVLLTSSSWLIVRTFAVSQVLGVRLGSVPMPLGLLELDFVW
jgi:hypothetical protein